MERIQSTAEKLQQELAVRGKYYFKGFGNLFQGVLADLEILAMIEDTPDRRKEIVETLNKINDLYKSIPFEQITNHPDYDLFFAIKEALFQLTSKIEAVLNGEKYTDEISQIMKFIVIKGEEYRARLSVLLNKLRLEPGHEKDGFLVTDIHGKTWSHPF